eukprot:658523-Pleurochrysis_carterae.AAC.2
MTAPAATPMLAVAKTPHDSTASATSCKGQVQSKNAHFSAEKVRCNAKMRTFQLKRQKSALRSYVWTEVCEGA